MPTTRFTCYKTAVQIAMFSFRVREVRHECLVKNSTMLKMSQRVCWTLLLRVCQVFVAKSLLGVFCQKFVRSLLRRVHRAIVDKRLVGARQTKRTLPIVGQQCHSAIWQFLPNYYCSYMGYGVTPDQKLGVKTQELIVFLQLKFDEIQND